MSVEPRPRAETRRGSAGWGALAVGGFAITLGSLTAMRRGSQAGGPAVRVALDLPEPLVAAVFALICLAGVLMLGLLFVRRRPRRRPEEEEFELYYEPPKVSPWIVALLLALALVPLAAAIVLLWQGWTPDLIVRAGPRGGAGLGIPSAPTPQGIDRPTASLPVFWEAVAGLALLAGLASAGFMLWILLGDRLAWWWAAAPVERREPEPLIEAVEAGLDDLRQHPDARRAIIACYRRFEEWAARSGFPRAPWATHTEFTRDALDTLALPRGAVSALARLFELSKFSQHPLRPADRDVAVASLVEIRSALDESQSHASAA